MGTSQLKESSFSVNLGEICGEGLGTFAVGDTQFHPSEKSHSSHWNRHNLS